MSNKIVIYVFPPDRPAANQQISHHTRTTLFLSYDCKATPSYPSGSEHTISFLCFSSSYRLVNIYRTETFIKKKRKLKQGQLETGPLCVI